MPDSFESVGAICTIDTNPAICTAEVHHFSTWAAVVPLDSDDDGIPDQFGVADVCPADPNIVDGLLPPLVELVPEEETVAPLPNMAFKLGRTLPLKLDYLCGAVPLTDAAGTAPPEIVGLERSGEAVPLEIIDPDAGAANDDGLAFRYSDEHWIHNFSTAGLGTGTFVITLELPDGRRFKSGFVLR